MKSELEYFDGLDNRKEIMILLFRLGSDERRKQFIESLIPHSLKGFKNAPMKVQGNCDPSAAYYMLVGICNELGVSINHAASLLEKEVKSNKFNTTRYKPSDPSVSMILDTKFGGK